METSTHTFANGLRVVTVPMPWLRSVSVAVFVHVGSRFETATTSGISHLTEHMLFKGTVDRPRSALITGALESVGGILNASTDKEITLYWAKVAAEQLPLSVNVIADMLRNSLVRPSDVAREREVISEELRMIADDPQDWAYVLADAALWPDHPYGRETAGSQSTVAAFRRGDVLDHIRRYYGPDNAVVTVAGGTTPDEVCRVVGDALTDWSMVHDTAPVCPPTETDGGTWLLEDKDFEQLNVCLAYPGVSREHPDRAPLEVLTTILGGGASSRLFEQMRERRALAYDVGVSTAHYADAGSIVISFGTEPQKGSAALDCVLRETERIQSRRVQDAELAKAKQLFSGRLWLALEDTNAVAGWFGTQEILQESVLKPEDAIELVEDVTTDDVRRVAKIYLRTDRMRVTAVGPTANLGSHALRASA
jgi:predicted Zn-dependent peptidase